MAIHQNLVVFGGNVGSVNFKSLPNTSVLDFSIASTQKFIDNTGATREVTEWMPVVVFGKRAEALKDCIVKGMNVVVTGQLKTQKWERDGHKFQKTQIENPINIQFGSKPDINRTVRASNTNPEPTPVDYGTGDFDSPSLPQTNIPDFHHLMDDDLPT